VAQETAHRPDVHQARNVGEAERLFREEGRRHQRKGGILGAAHLHLTPQALPASNDELIHLATPWKKAQKEKMTTDD
jgi:hypothetical protein